MPIGKLVNSKIQIVFHYRVESLGASPDRVNEANGEGTKCGGRKNS